VAEHRLGRGDGRDDAKPERPADVLRGGFEDGLGPQRRLGLGGVRLASPARRGSGVSFSGEVV
jgi:hypothetical protein